MQSHQPHLMLQSHAPRASLEDPICSRLSQSVSIWHGA